MSPQQDSFHFRDSLQRRFEAYHQARPEIFDHLVKLCFEVKAMGFKRYGIGSLWEVMRWHFQIDKKMGDDFKLNNDYRSRYARLIVATYPEFDGFFEMRELRA